jgi:hypothetical protein
MLASGGVTDFRWDKDEAVAIEEEARSVMADVERGSAQLSEFTVGTPLEARAPLTDVQREVAVALNVVCDLLGRKAREASERGEARWEGLYDAATLTWNELARLGLPQIASSMFDYEDDDEASAA